jgi:microcystin-dependent protein
LPPGGFYLAEDGSAISRSLFAACFGVIGTQHGTGDGSTTFNVPDSRGRQTVGYAPSGGHADVSSVGGTDGLALASRRTRHQHNVVVTKTDTGHSHGLSNFGSVSHNNGGSAGGTIVDSNQFNPGGAIGVQAATTGITIGVTVGPQTGAEPVDGPAFIVKYKLIRVA